MPRLTFMTVLDYYSYKYLDRRRSKVITITYTILVRCYRRNLLIIEVIRREVYVIVVSITVFTIFIIYF